MKYKYIIQAIIVLLSFGCTAVPDKSEILYGSGCKLWWLYDEIIGGPTAGFICFNKNKYRSHMITRFGTLVKPIYGDVVYAVTEFGQWSIANDSLYLQNKPFSPIKISSDTIYLGPKSFLVDATNKFNINNCDCDSLDAQFKGGRINSFKEVFNPPNKDSILLSEYFNKSINLVTNDALDSLNLRTVIFKLMDEKIVAQHYKDIVKIFGKPIHTFITKDSAEALFYPVAYTSKGKFGSKLFVLWLDKNLDIIPGRGWIYSMETEDFDYWHHNLPETSHEGELNCPPKYWN